MGDKMWSQVLCARLLPDALIDASGTRLASTVVGSLGWNCPTFLPAARRQFIFGALLVTGHFGRVYQSPVFLTESTVLLVEMLTADHPRRMLQKHQDPSNSQDQRQTFGSVTKRPTNLPPRGRSNAFGWVKSALLCSLED